MKYLKRLNKPILACFVFLLFNSYTMQGFTSKDPLTLDKSIRTGHLSNGFSYYIKPTKETDKLSLRFYVKVGYFNERLSEKEFAHLAEHLGYHQGYQKAFNENDIAFGNLATYSNAFTSMAYTVYYSSLSSNDYTTLRKRLQWFANISHLKLKDSVITQEARCLRQELFSRDRGLALDKTFKESIYKTSMFFNKDGESPYTSWLNTYDMGGISVESLRNFYYKWYRPDRMGLVVIGNIQNINRLEQQLIDLFSRIPKSTENIDSYDLRQFYLSAPHRFKTVERVEVNRFSKRNNENSEISLVFRVKKFHKELETREKWLNEQLYKSTYQMIHKRLKEKGESSKSTEEKEFIDVVLPDRNCSYFKVSIIENKPENERKNIQRVTSILQQLIKNGFTEQEWIKQKDIMLSQFNSIDTSSITYWEKQLEKHFVYGELLPTQKKAITKRWIDSLSLNDINSYLENNFSVMPDDIYITASAGHPALTLTEKQVRRWIRESIKNPVDLKETNVITSLTPVTTNTDPLMTSKEIESLKEVGYEKVGIDPDAGFEVLKLGNGVNLMLDQKEINSNSSGFIYVTGRSLKGASCFPKEEYYTVISAPEIVKLSGAGGFNRKTILNKLGGEFPLNTEPVQLRIQNDESTISTRAKLENLEKYLQLIYLYCTSPKKDTLAFVEWQGQTRKRYLEDTFDVVSPMSNDMGNAIADFLDVPFFKPPTYLMSTQQFYEKQNVSYEKAMQRYHAIFGNGSDFTFVIKGSYNKNEVLPLLQKYLGNLPSNDHLFCVPDNTDKTATILPKGPIYHTFYANKMKTAYKLYTAPYVLSYVFVVPESNWKDRVVLNIINTYLLPKVRFELRYRKGISLFNAYTKGNYSETNTIYSLAIYVDVLDDEIESIRTESRRLIANLKNQGICIEEKDRILKNPLFLGRYSVTPKLQEKVMRYGHSLTSEDIKRVARKYLKENHQYEFVFRESEKNIVIQ